MKVIYEPKGRAKEYSDLALNNYICCPHACKYCFGPSVMRSDREKYHIAAKPRTEAVNKWFEHDCIEMEKRNDTRRVHLNFVSDPYPDIETELGLTRYCIETAMKHGVKINILTKGRYDVVKRDLELFKEADVHFGMTLCFSDDRSRQEWEPNASTVSDRLKLLEEAHNLGVFTWISMEPVIYPCEALGVLRGTFDMIDLYKVGKLNYHPFSKKVDWGKFRDDFIKETKEIGLTEDRYIIKNDLLEAKYSPDLPRLYPSFTPGDSIIKGEK